MKWIDAELKVFKEQYAALKERIALESTESMHAANVLEQSKAITLAVRPSISPPQLPETPPAVGPLRSLAGADCMLSRISRQRDCACTVTGRNTC